MIEASDPRTTSGRLRRGRHAPPIEVRRDEQRRRLLRAAAEVFARCGYSEASAEGISREAGMSKATFYEHFGNKEECMVALFDAAAEAVMGAMSRAAADAPQDPTDRLRAGIRAFLAQVDAHPSFAQTFLVEIIGAGPRAAERRDAILEEFAGVLVAENARAAELHGVARFASHDDAFGVVGAIVELASRQLRLGRPERMLDLEPVIERLILGALSQSNS